MATTALFVELVVIGFGAAIWVVLLACSLFGSEWLAIREQLGVVLALPSIAFVYVLGIVSDRVIDGLFGKVWGHDGDGVNSPGGRVPQNRRQPGAHPRATRRNAPREEARAFFPSLRAGG